MKFIYLLSIFIKQQHFILNQMKLTHMTNDKYYQKKCVKNSIDSSSNISLQRLLKNLPYRVLVKIMYMVLSSPHSIISQNYHKYLKLMSRFNLYKNNHIQHVISKYPIYNKNIHNIKLTVDSDGYNNYGPESYLYDLEIDTIEIGKVGSINLVRYIFHREYWFRGKDTEPFELIDYKLIDPCFNNEFVEIIRDHKY